ncbi:cyclic nucleotide-binding domain-containing protein [Dactylosporangium sp. NPDC051541]|uniref:cyclic nucleotide-binding domain-containing protein n=1 Tax=Dactylosporangium sp. NPDC051541 TaxID=3363977 RepID=UPI00379F4C4D
MITTYDLLVAHPFLDGLPADQVERLSRWARRAPYRAGTRIFEERSHAQRFWLIREGSVDLQTRTPGRGEIVVETLGPGSVLGWSWMFPPYRWHFSAVTVDPVLSVVLDGVGVRALCRDDPVLGYELTTRFMAVVVDRMQATRARLLDLDEAPA